MLTLRSNPCTMRSLIKYFKIIFSCLLSRSTLYLQQWPFLAIFSKFIPSVVSLHLVSQVKFTYCFAQDCLHQIPRLSFSLQSLFLLPYQPCPSFYITPYRILDNGIPHCSQCSGNPSDSHSSSQLHLFKIYLQQMMLHEYIFQSLLNLG